MKVSTLKGLAQGTGVIALLVLLVAVVILVPLAVIWSLNTLVPAAGIQYGFLQWLSVVIVGAFCSR